MANLLRTMMTTNLAYMIIEAWSDRVGISDALKRHAVTMTVPSVQSRTLLIKLDWPHQMVSLRVASRLVSDNEVS